MKKQLTLLVFFLLGTVLYSQTIDTNFNTTKERKKQLSYTTIELEINAIVDMKPVTDSVLLIVNYDNYTDSIKAPNKFKIYLRYDIDYNIQISYPEYTAKLLRIDTRGARKDDWQLKATVSLNKSSQTICYVGGFGYRDKTFKKIY